MAVRVFMRVWVWVWVTMDRWPVRSVHTHPPPTTQPNPTPPNRANRAKHAPLMLRPGSIKKLLRRVKLPREFAVHRTALPSSPPSHDDHGDKQASSSPLVPELPSPRSAGSSRAWEERLGQQPPAPRPVVDSAADWLMVFDTEFSPNMAIKVRTTRQIPVSGAYG